MRTVQLTVLKFEELSKEAKENALDEFQEMDSYSGWEDENLNSLTLFCNEFGLSYYSYSGYSSNGQNVGYTVEKDEDIQSLSGVRLSKYLQNNHGQVIDKPKYKGDLSTNEEVKHPRIKSSEPYNNGNRFNPYYSAVFTERGCNLCGYYIDMDLLQPIWDFIDNPTDKDFATLMDDCLRSWSKTHQREHLYRKSEKFYREYCAEHSIEFTEDGEIFEAE